MVSRPSSPEKGSRPSSGSAASQKAPSSISPTAENRSPIQETSEVLTSQSPVFEVGLDEISTKLTHITVTRPLAQRTRRANSAAVGVKERREKLCQSYYKGDEEAAHNGTSPASQSLPLSPGTKDDEGYKNFKAQLENSIGSILSKNAGLAKPTLESVKTPASGRSANPGLSLQDELRQKLSVQTMKPEKTNEANSARTSPSKGSPTSKPNSASEVAPSQLFPKLKPVSPEAKLPETSPVTSVSPVQAKITPEPKPSSPSKNQPFIMDQLKESLKAKPLHVDSLPSFNAGSQPQLTSPKKKTEVNDETSKVSPTKESEDTVPEFLALRSKLRSVRQQNEVKTSSSPNSPTTAIKTTNAPASVVPRASSQTSISSPTEGAQSPRKEYSRFAGNSFASRSTSPVRAIVTSPSKTINPSFSEEKFRKKPFRSSSSVIGSHSSLTSVDKASNASDEPPYFREVIRSRSNSPIRQMDTKRNILDLEPMLLLIKGKRATAKKISLDKNLVCSGEVYILDLPGLRGRFLFVICSSKTPKVPRNRALELANLMKDSDYGGNAEVELVELLNFTSRVVSDKDQLFWKTLLGETSKVSVEQTLNFAQQVEVKDTCFQEATFEKELEENTVLHRLCNGNFKQVGQGSSIVQSMLYEGSVSILDCKEIIFVWSDRKASEQERQEAFTFIKKLDRKALVLEEPQRFERVIFKLMFKDWAVGKELSARSVLQVKLPGNVQSKSKEWKVYDRGCDRKQTDSIDIQRMYDKSASLGETVKSDESFDLAPSELIHRDWGWVNMRVFQFHGMQAEKGAYVSLTKDALTSLEVNNLKISSPFHFRSDHCYIFFYQFKDRPPMMTDSALTDRMKFDDAEELVARLKDVALLYIWIGSQSAVSDQTILAHAATEIEKVVLEESPSLKKTKHIRITEGHEPEHFFNAISGVCRPPGVSDKIMKLLLQGPSAQTVSSLVFLGSNISNASLFRAQGLMNSMVRVVQMQSVSVRHLCSANSYIVVSPTKAYVWNGKGAFAFEKEAATCFAKKSHSEVEIVAEGSEPPEFWSLFEDAKAQVAMDADLKWLKKAGLTVAETNVNMALSCVANRTSVPYDIRLWHITQGVHNNPVAIEYSPFCQSDLEPSGAYILDGYFWLWVWFGEDFVNTKVEKSQESLASNNSLTSDSQVSRTSSATSYKTIALALKTAKAYVEFVHEHDNGRLSLSDAFVTQSGNEPLTFRNQFFHWTPLPAHEHMGAFCEMISLEQAMKKFEKQVYSIDQLRLWVKDKNQLPLGVDPEKLEDCLDDDVFGSVFGMDRTKFSSLAVWKKKDIKRKAGLF